MAGSMKIVFILSFVTTSVLCQTFQYSHGWTNGKRAPPEVTSQLSLPSSWMKNLDTTQYNTAVRCDIHGMRLLFQPNANEAPYVIPCEVSPPKRSYGQRRGSMSESSNSYQI